MDGRFCSYLRVSTDKQGRDGLGIEAQRAAVAAHLNGGNWQLLKEYVEVESGAHNDRPELAKALTHCKLTGAKLIVAKLDRLSRDAAFLLALQRGAVPFVCADMPDANELTINILAVVAQAERKAISQRTRAALQAAKERGVKMGGFRGYVPDPDTATEARQRRADGFAEQVGPMIRDMRRGGCSLTQIAAKLAADGIRTARGGQWTPTAVSNVLRRVGGVTKP